MKPTAEQLKVLDLVANSDENILINSGAGTGKTTMLRLIDEEINGRIPIRYHAFNKRVVEEAQEPDDEGNAKFNETTEIRTINSAGYAVWRSASNSRLTVDGNKTLNIFRTIVESLSSNERTEAWEEYTVIKHGVEMAKSLGYVPDGWRAKGLISADDLFYRLEEIPSNFAKELINDILNKSIRLSYDGCIDFNDQVYMPALFRSSVPKIPLLMEDERQDFSPVNDELSALFVENGARLIAVGDPFQSIYGFRGAMHGGMAKTKERFEMIETDLTVSFRCPSEIVKAAQWRVPHLKWSKEGGYVSSLDSLFIDDIPDGTAIICRNNAPLFALALKLLAGKRGVSVAGSELGPKILKIMKKLGPAKMDREDLVMAIEDWLSAKLEVQSTTASDTAQCMRVFAGFGRTLSEAMGYAEYMFKQRGPILLTTGHKAKGLEWETIYHLDPSLIGKVDQELNLKYVIQTRSKDKFFTINSEAIYATE